MDQKVGGGGPMGWYYRLASAASWQLAAARGGSKGCSVRPARKGLHLFCAAHSTAVSGCIHKMHGKSPGWSPAKTSRAATTAHLPPVHLPSPRYSHPAPQGISKVVGDMWAQLSAEDRAPYNEAAQADRERYDQEVKQHQARFPLVSRQRVGVAGRLAGRCRSVVTFSTAHCRRSLWLLEVTQPPASPTHSGATTHHLQGTRRELHRNAGPPAMLADQPPQPQHQQYAHQQHQHQHQHQQQYEGGGGTFSSHQYQSSQEPSVTAAMAAAGAGPPDRGGWSGEMSIGLSAMPPPAVGLPMPWSAKGPGGAQATRHSGMEASAASQHSPPGSATPYQTVLGQLGLLPAPQAAARRAAPVPQPGQQGGSPAEVLQALLQQLEPGRQQQGQQQAQVQAEAQQQGTTISQLLSALMPRPGQAPIGDPAAPAAAQADAPSTVQLTTEVLALLMRAQQQPPH